MSSATARTSLTPRRRRAVVRRRRIALGLVVVVLAGVGAAVIAGLGPLDRAVREAFTLPLRHEDIIRQQAREKGLDPALIAAIIYEESKFRDQTSHAGARGLMQITPATADFIARDSGGTRFTQRDLATPQINISYGSYYLRYLMRRYDNNDVLAVAAYNAGETRVNEWIERAGSPEAFDAARHIPFPETRHYVRGVMKHREDYRAHYGRELGL